METKLIELRDAATCISMIAIKMEPFKDNALNKYPILWRDKSGVVSTLHAREEWILQHAGYGTDSEPLILYFRIDQPSQWRWSSRDWPSDDRTFSVTHRYLEEHWNEVQNCDVVDAQFILGETKIQKKTDQFWVALGEKVEEVAQPEPLPDSPEERIAEMRKEYGEANVWTTEELERDFEVESFTAPFCIVIRKLDRVRGFVRFVDDPRWYFDFHISTYQGEIKNG